MKKLISIVLIASLSGTVFLPFVPYLTYFSNYNYIVNHLCENRNNPDVDCNGACYLNKEIEESHNHEHGDKDRKTTHNVERNQILLAVVTTVFSFERINSNSKRRLETNNKFYSSPYLEYPSPPPRTV